MRSRVLLVLCLTILAALPSSGQALHPNLERGFASDKAYSIGEIDHVNLFNGNLTVAIPIGGKTQISEKLSLGLTLTYNSKLWEMRRIPIGYVTGQATHRQIPDPMSNAGFGWVLSLGRLVGPGETDINSAGGWTYQSPDGGLHAFSTFLHPNEPETDFLYTTDGTYMRLRVASNMVVVEFPDGLFQEFSPWSDAGIPRWRLTATRDRHGNHYTVAYTATEWIITDKHGRVTTVTFASTPEPTSTGRTYSAPNLRSTVKSITLPGFDGTTARYEFTYEAADVRRGYCGQEEEPTDDPYVAVPLLRKIQLFHGLTEVGVYQAAYDVFGTPDTVPVEQKCRAGTLISLQLPTRATLRWTYGIYILPGDCRAELIPDRSNGVLSRTFDAPTAGEFATDADQTWTYTPALTPEPGSSFQCQNTLYLGNPPSMEMTNTVRSPVGDETVNYFSVWPNIAAPSPAEYREFGLPLSRRGAAPDATTFISTKVCKGSCSSGANVRRTTYVAYEQDKNAPALGGNRRLRRTKTVHHDNAGNPLDWVETVYSNFDGVGHYRVATTTGDFGQGLKTRTVTTNFNKRDTQVSSDGSLTDTGTYDAATGEGFRMPPRWVLDTYTSIQVTDGATSTRELTCFDPNTGALRARRVLANPPSTGATDLLTVFDRSTNTTLNGGAPGFVTTESFFGGDATPLTPTTASALCDFIDPFSFAQPPAPLAYQIRHTYRFGVRVTSTPYERDGVTPMPFKTLDLDVDPNGQASAVRDTAQVATTYDYDPSGRIESIKPPGVARIDYDYTPATGSTRARVTTTQLSESGTLRRELQFDSLGRPVVEVRNVGNQLVSRTTSYDSGGSIAAVTEWNHTAATRYADFDPFGRPMKITAPDGSVTTIAHTGGRTVARTRRYRSPAGQVSTTTTETYDPFGRLVALTEEGGPTGPNDHTGALVTASYDYDTGDRLTRVTVTPQGGTPQQRTFTYDGRGMLLAEKHPEFGGAEARYAIDAQGRPVAKTFPTASHMNLAFDYDPAGRQIAVRGGSGAGAKVVKEFTYGTVGTARGRLETARRYNYLPGSPDHYRVTETYAYLATGQVQRRTTNIDKVAGGTTTAVRWFSHSRTYNDTGATASVNYPQCVGCTNATRTVDYDYHSGFPSAIPGFVDAISYAPSAMVTRIDHANGVSDIISPSPHGLPRPSAIRFEVQCTVPQINVQPADASVEKDSDVLLQVVAGGTAPQYQWSRRAASSGTWSDIAGATGSSLTAPVSEETLFRVTVSNACGTVQSREARVTVFERPRITSQPQALQTKNAGETATLTVAAAGTAPLSYQWYRGTSGDDDEPIAAPAGTGSSYTTPALAGSVSYWVRVGNDHGVADSNTARIDVVLAAPTNLTATALTADSLRLTWTASAHAAKYRIERMSAGSFASYATVNAPAVTFTDTGVESGKAYAYRVVALDQNGGSASGPSNAEFASLYVFSPVTAATPVSAAVFDELLGGINALRVAAGDQALTWPAVTTAPPPASGGEILAAYVTALRTHANLARGELGSPGWSFPDPVVPSTTELEALFITELQAALR